MAAAPTATYGDARSPGQRHVSAQCDHQGGTLRAVEADSLARAAALLRERNAIDAELARLIQRPMTSGHLAEWIAAQVFDIELEASAVAAGIGGRLRSGPLAVRGRKINRDLNLQSLLRTPESTALSYYVLPPLPP